MLKKLLLLSFAAIVTAACNDEADDGVRYATSNPEIVDGVYSGQNMHFYGTATVTHVTDGSTYTDPEAWFEFAGGKELTIYMHATRFAAAMPALEMRIHRMPYTPGEGASLSFTAASTVPQVRLPNEVGGGYSYQDMPSYTLTDVEGSVEEILCRISFTCDVPRLGTYRMEYEGLLLVKNSPARADIRREVLPLQGKTVR